MHKTEAYLIGIYRHLTYTWKRQGKQVVTLESEKIQLEIMVKHTYVCMLITKHAFGKLYQKPCYPTHDWLLLKFLYLHTKKSSNEKWPQFLLVNWLILVNPYLKKLSHLLLTDICHYLFSYKSEQYIIV